jgi:hypothetical protein
MKKRISKINDNICKTLLSLCCYKLGNIGQFLAVKCKDEYLLLV